VLGKLGFQKRKLAAELDLSPPGWRELRGTAGYLAKLGKAGQQVRRL